MRGSVWHRKRARGEMAPSRIRCSLPGSPPTALRVQSGGDVWSADGNLSHRGDPRVGGCREGVLVAEEKARVGRRLFDRAGVAADAAVDALILGVTAAVRPSGRADRIICVAVVSALAIPR